MVATDSYRLSVKQTELESEVGGELEANIPARALRELARILVSEERRDGRDLAARQPGGVRRRPGGPDHAADRGPVPQPPPAAAGVLRARRPPARAASSSRWRAGSASSRSETRRCGSRCKPGELTVAAETPEVGDATETMPAAFEGEPLEIGFNPEFLKDGIESVEGDEVLLRADLAAAPGAAAAGRGRGLPLPRDADPPQRLGRPALLVCSLDARDFRSLEQLRARARARDHLGGGRQRHRQDQPAGGDLLRRSAVAPFGPATAAS